MRVSYLIAFILFFWQVSEVFTRSGSEIETIAHIYLNHTWTCNDRNARNLTNTNNRYDNTDNDDDNNDINHSFYPNDAACKNARGETVISTGQYTGVAYAWGNRETPGEYDTKLASQEPNEYLAGSEGISKVDSRINCNAIDSYHITFGLFLGTGHQRKHPWVYPAVFPQRD